MLNTFMLITKSECFSLLQKLNQLSLLLWQTTSELWWLYGGKRGHEQNCLMLYCILKLCTVISTLRWAVLTILWIGFCHTGPISLSLDSCSFFHAAHVLYYCLTRWGGPGNWSLILRTLSSFNAFTLLVESLDLWKHEPNMTYNVSGGMLNLTPLQLNQLRTSIVVKLRNKSYKWNSRLKRDIWCNQFQQFLVSKMTAMFWRLVICNSCMDHIFRNTQWTSTPPSSNALK